MDCLPSIGCRTDRRRGFSPIAEYRTETTHRWNSQNFQRDVWVIHSLAFASAKADEKDFNFFILISFSSPWLLLQPSKIHCETAGAVTQRLIEVWLQKQLRKGWYAAKGQAITPVFSSGSRTQLCSGPGDFLNNFLQWGGLNYLFYPFFHRIDLFLNLNGDLECPPPN